MLMPAALPCQASRLRSVSVRRLEHDERGQAQGDRADVGALRLEVVDAVGDEQSVGLGLAGDGARHDGDGAELAQHAGRGQRHAVGEAPADVGQRDAAEDGERPGPERAGRLLLLGADLLEHRQHLAHDVGQRDRRRGHDDAGHREDHGDAVRGQPVAEPAGLAVDEDQREADDDGGDGERDVDERIEQPGAREAVAGQDERHPDAEDRVERHGDGDHEQREQQRVQGVRRGEGIPRRPESGREGVVEDRADRHDDEQRQVDEDDDAQRQAPAGALHTVSGTSKRRRAQPMPMSTSSEMATSTIGHRAGAREVVALGQPEDLRRGDLGLEREVARNEDDRAELADGPGEGQAGAGQHRGQHAREDDPAQHLAPRRAEGGGGVLGLRIELGQHRLDAAHAEGQRHEEQRGGDAEAGAGQVDVQRAVDAVEREQRQAGHDGGQREGQVDDGARRAPCRGSRRARARRRWPGRRWS